jgi:hypothetical protein
LQSCEHGTLEVNTVIRAAAVLLGRAYRLLDGARCDVSRGLAEATEEASYEVDGLVSMATELASYARIAQRELHTHLDRGALLAGEAPVQKLRLGVCRSEEILERVQGCAGEILNDLRAAVETLGPTPRELRAVDDLLARLRSSHA